MKTLAEGSRLQHLDVLRGIAAFMVCLCHFHHAFSPAIGKLFLPLGDYGVFIFFVISGFIIPRALSKEAYRIPMMGRYLSRRIVRLHPPYLLALALTLVLSSAAALWKGASPAWSPTDLLAYFFYVQAPAENPVFWTLRVEMCFYIALGIAFPLLNSKKFLLRCAAFVLPCVAWIFLAENFLFVRFIAFFLLGIALDQYQRGVSGSTEFILKFAAAATLAKLQTGWGGMIVGLLAAAMIAAPFRVTWPRFALWFGAISYSFYLVHFPVGVKFLNLVMAKVQGVPTELLAMAAFILSVVAAWLLYLIAERPAIAWSRAIATVPPSTPTITAAAQWLTKR